jgi:hypothetical protein
MGSDGGVERSRLLGFLDFSRRPGLYYSLGTETDPVSDTLYFLEYWTMGKRTKNSVIERILNIQYLLFQQVLSLARYASAAKCCWLGRWRIYYEILSLNHNS